MCRFRNRLVAPLAETKVQWEKIKQKSVSASPFFGSDAATKKNMHTVAAKISPPRMEWADGISALDQNKKWVKYFPFLDGSSGYESASKITPIFFLPTFIQHYTMPMPTTLWHTSLPLHIYSQIMATHPSSSSVYKWPWELRQCLTIGQCSSDSLRCLTSIKDFVSMFNY